MLSAWFCARLQLVIMLKWVIFKSNIDSRIMDNSLVLAKPGQVDTGLSYRLLTISERVRHRTCRGEFNNTKIILKIL